MHSNSKPWEEICFSFSRQRFETLECETDLQLSPGDIVKVKFEIFDDLGYLVGGHFSGYLNAKHELKNKPANCPRHDCLEAILSY